MPNRYANLDGTKPIKDEYSKINVGFDAVQAEMDTAVFRTTADLTYYVRPDGNDNNNGLANTAAGAFKSITKALSVVPKVVNHAATIFVADGSYPENVVVKDFIGGGYVKITGNTATPANVTVTSFLCKNNSAYIELTGLKVTGTGAAVKFEHCLNAAATYIISDSAGQHGIFAVFRSHVAIYQCQLSNKSVGAVLAQYSSSIHSEATTGTGNGVGLYADRGGVITKHDAAQPGGTVKEQIGFGGYIISGVINPWGDNTTSSRSFVSRGHNVAQTFTTGIYTKINWTNPGHDQLLESDANGRVTVKEGGIYTINVHFVLATAVASGKGGTLHLYRNGAGAGQIVRNSFSGGSFPMFEGMIRTVLNSGDYVEIYLLMEDTTVTSQPDPSASYMTMIRSA